MDRAVRLVALATLALSAGVVPVHAGASPHVLPEAEGDAEAPDIGGVYTASPVAGDGKAGSEGLEGGVDRPGEGGIGVDPDAAFIDGLAIANGLAIDGAVHSRGPGEFEEGLADRFGGCE